jgi:ribosomal protein S4
MVQTGFGAFGWYEMMSRVKRSLVRLDRALSKLGVASRSEAKRLIAEGRVRVGGRVVRDAALPVTPERGTVTVDGSRPTSSSNSSRERTGRFVECSTRSDTRSRS